MYILHSAHLFSICHISSAQLALLLDNVGLTLKMGPVSSIWCGTPHFLLSPLLPKFIYFISLSSAVLWVQETWSRCFTCFVTVCLHSFKKSDFLTVISRIQNSTRITLKSRFTLQFAELTQGDNMQGNTMSHKCAVTISVHLWRGKGVGSVLSSSLSWARAHGFMRALPWQVFILLSFIMVSSPAWFLLTYQNFLS